MNINLNDLLNITFNGQAVLTVVFNGTTVYTSSNNRITNVKFFSRNSTNDTIVNIPDHKGAVLAVVEYEGNIGTINYSLLMKGGISSTFKVTKYGYNLFVIEDCSNYDNDLNKYEATLTFSATNTDTKITKTIQRVNTSYGLNLNTEKGNHKVIVIEANGWTNTADPYVLYFYGKHSYPEKIGKIDGTKYYPYIENNYLGKANESVPVEMVIDNSYNGVVYNPNNMITILSKETIYNDAKVTYTISPNTTNLYRFALINIRYTANDDNLLESIVGKDDKVSIAGLIIIQKPQE